ncbi:MAG: hypothetical protein LQ338_003751 [Usnochroma carphineum]|nr:MAG: hypothetical protein LQ338_003751 [Usnochroma carphineum]
MSTLVADYVVVGGGLTGCVIASRLKQKDPSLTIIVLEAGPNPESKHDVVTPMGGFALQGSELDWQYSTKPNHNTQNRTHTLTAGKTLGGGSILNYGGWSRGDAADYNTWSRLTGYKHWDYAHLLPYFQRTERFDPTEKAPLGLSPRGLDGPMRITSVSGSSHKRRYPLGEPLCNAWAELGVQREAYGCTGRNQGLSEWLENWDNGRRQAAHQAYPLDGVQVLTGTPVARVLFANGVGASITRLPTASETPKVTGVFLQDGREVQAQREVILCAGAIRSPIILMDSGIGPKSHLSIPVVRDIPGVGANMIDHFALFQLFKLKASGKGLALGHPDLNDPAFFLGMPSDYVVNLGLPQDLLEKALEEDGITGAERDALLEPDRCFLELLVLYHPLSAPVPADGTFISTSVMLTLPSSRGTVSNSDDIHETHPVVNPGYFATALDRLALVHGVRRMLQLMLGAKALHPYIEAEVPPPGFSPLHPGSSDTEIEARIRATGVAHYHTTGTCALGSVVDANLRVKGIEGLRVCDGSVLPSPVGGHPQATLYGIAEMAAEVILQEGELD